MIHASPILSQSETAFTRQPGDPVPHRADRFHLSAGSAGASVYPVYLLLSGPDYGTRVINDAIYEELAKDNVRYDNLVTLTQNAQGEITPLQTDMVAGAAPSR